MFLGVVRAVVLGVFSAAQDLSSNKDIGDEVLD